MIRKKKQEQVRFKSVICPALNVRTKPYTSALISSVLPYGQVVECDENFKDDIWDHVFAINLNVDGYCMKRYLLPLTEQELGTINIDPIIIRAHNSVCDSSEEKKEDDKE